MCQKIKKKWLLNNYWKNEDKKYIDTNFYSQKSKYFPKLFFEEYRNFYYIKILNIYNIKSSWDFINYKIIILSQLELNRAFSELKHHLTFLIGGKTNGLFVSSTTNSPFEMTEYAARVFSSLKKNKKIKIT